MIKSTKELNGVAIDEYGNEKYWAMNKPPINYKKKGIGILY